MIATIVGVRSERGGEGEDGGTDFIKQMSRVIAVDRLGFKIYTRDGQCSHGVY